MAGCWLFTSVLRTGEVVMQLIRYAWFPYLFALGLPRTVDSHNQAAFAGVDVIRPAVFLVLVAALLVAILRRVIPNQVLAAVMATVPLLGIWLLGFGWEFYGLMALWIALCFLLRERSLPESSVSVFNALAVGVVFLPVVTILQVERITYSNWGQNIPYSPFSAVTTTQIAGDKPDIYHFVLDAYAGSDALGGVLGFDNSEFFDELRDLGFAVNESVIVPYNETVHTMSAIFLGEYLREGEFPINSEFPPQLRSTLGALIVKGPVHEFLSNNGYSVLYTDPGHEFLRFPGNAVVLGPKNAASLSRFELHLGSVAGLNNVFPGLYESFDEDPLIRSVKNAFSNDFSELPSPKFAYQHVLAPHTPFTIDREGETTLKFPGFTSTGEGDAVVRDDPARRQIYVDGYLEKLRYVNSRILEQLRTILSMPGKKIIVLHGDHGSGSQYWLNDPDKTCLRERFTSFVAVYSDDAALSNEFEWVSSAEAAPVNLYRSVMNGLADQGLEMLPNQSAFVRYSAPHQILPLDSAQIPLACH